ncbi:hypothetical protein PsorP6_018183 [Peronosclerospora sorghi]|uniref:Uncharacterized protein n=1 Tax=Peronosclerospora sorghi TaxID=230839 RepID=A0ACC0WD44_9STRA|nr:hypothetical protein PsorP6_018183 [Peronosclerospora sorghi]
MPSRQYSKALMLIEYSDTRCEPDISSKTQWLYQYSLKVSSSIMDGLRTIRMDLIFIVYTSRNSYLLRCYYRQEFTVTKAEENHGPLLISA